MLAVAISGSPRAPSKSKTLAELMLTTLEQRACAIRLIDLATLPADGLLARVSSPEVDGAIAAAGEAQIVIAATPTYRALYTGLLKAFFDLMPPGHLEGKACVAVQTAAVAQHSLAIEYGLYPLFRSLDGAPVGGVYATDEEFVDGQPEGGLLARIEAVAALALRYAGEL